MLDDNYNSTAEETSIEITAILEKPKFTIANTNNQQADFTGFLLVDAVPIGIKLPAEGHLIFTNGQEGDCQVLQKPPNPYYKEEKLMGIAIDVQWADQ